MDEQAKAVRNIDDGRLRRENKAAKCQSETLLVVFRRYTPSCTPLPNSFLLYVPEWKVSALVRTREILLGTAAAGGGVLLVTTLRRTRSVMSLLALTTQLSLRALS